jgi:Rrf2 family nitric oxide-sensitive transcriptional repressor
MRLTSYTDYCLRVLMYLAAHPEQRATIGEIARCYDISENHLVKVVHFLGKSGFLHNVRGRGGGLTLARPASKINVGHVVRSAEGAPVPAACFNAEAQSCSIASACRLRGVLGEAVKAFYAVLDGYTLADIVQGARGQRELRMLLHGPLRMPGDKARAATKT